MSVVIIGGNECMERQYKKICEKHKCKAKVFTRMKGNLKTQIGQPDLVILFHSDRGAQNGKMRDQRSTAFRIKN